MAIKAQKSGGFCVKCCHLFSRSSLQKFTAFACRYPSFLSSGYVILHRISLSCFKHPFNGPFSRTTKVSRYQKGKTNLDFTEARDSEWQWHQLGHMQVCTSLQTNIHASTPPLSFLQAGCPSCRPTNSVKALKAFPALKATQNFPQVSQMWLVPVDTAVASHN